MNTFMLLAAILPAILLGLYIWRKDPQPEPTRWLLRAFFAGVGLCIPVALLEHYVMSALFVNGGPTTLFGTTAEAFLVAALPEESAKLIALWLILRKNPYFDERFDGIVYAVCVGLGFAAIENVFYVLGSGEGWVTVAAMRALLAVPGHYAFAIMMGYYYSVYYFSKRTPANAVKILLVPVLAHGVYDSIAMSGTVDPIAAGLSTFVLIWFCIKLQKAAQRKVLSLRESSLRNLCIIGLCFFLITACNKPSKVEQYKADKHIRDSVALVDQQRTLNYYQTQLDSMMPVADSLIALFKYERNEKYQDHGNYVLNGKNGLRILVRDDGKELLLYQNGKRINDSSDPAIERAKHLQIVISDIKELEKRVERTSFEVQKYQKRLQK